MPAPQHPDRVGAPATTDRRARWSGSEVEWREGLEPGPAGDEVAARVRAGPLRSAQERAVEAGQGLGALDLLLVERAEPAPGSSCSWRRRSSCTCIHAAERWSCRSRRRRPRTCSRLGCCWSRIAHGARPAPGPWLAAELNEVLTAQECALAAGEPDFATLDRRFHGSSSPRPATSSSPANTTPCATATALDGNHRRAGPDTDRALHRRAPQHRRRARARRPRRRRRLTADHLYSAARWPRPRFQYERAAPRAPVGSGHGERPPLH
jgi:hypothetical protein